MYELVQAGKHSYYVDCPSKIGIVVDGNDAYLIDSGSDKDAGRKVRQILDKQCWHLKAIFNTHSHADHIGGNQYLAGQTGCPIYALGIEAAFTRDPVLEPTMLWGGCAPQELRDKFLMAKPTAVQLLTNAVLPPFLKSIPLPGHSFDMVGFRVDDGTVFVADSLSSEATLQKYGIGFVYDVAAYIDTLKNVMTLTGETFVPSHAPACEDISGLAAFNIEKTNEAAECIANLCTAPISFEDILAGVFAMYDLDMNFRQYALIGSTVRSYLTYLKTDGRIEAFFEGGRMLWKTV